MTTGMFYEEGSLGEETPSTPNWSAKKTVLAYRCMILYFVLYPRPL